MREIRLRSSMREIVHPIDQQIVKPIACSLLTFRNQFLYSVILMSEHGIREPATDGRGSLVSQAYFTLDALQRMMRWSRS